MNSRLTPPSPVLYDHLILTALREDLGVAGDLTTEATVSAGARGEASIGTRATGVVAGIEVAARAFTLFDPEVIVDVLIGDGARVAPGDVIARVVGPARAILTAERTALNLLGRLCGIATLTASVVEAVAGTGASVVCTRKTTPGLRVLEKYAVRAGGGANHRFGLDDAVLVKDNHIAFAGGLLPALAGVRERIGHLTMVEVEVESLVQLEELLTLRALGYPVNAVLLDNFDPDQLRAAVEAVAGAILTEASGGIGPGTARAVAETGVDLLSLGWLTHSATVLDVGLDVEPG
jgi:nicotinate-nucleotide pyrophosphorylase (carboxylating)